MEIAKGIIPTFGDLATIEDLTPEEKAWTIPAPQDVEAPRSYAFTYRKAEAHPHVAIAHSDDFNRVLIKGSNLIHSSPEAAHKAWGSLNTALSDYAQSISDPAEREGELDIVSKFSIQRRFSPTWFVTDQRPGPPVNLSPKFRKALSLVAGLFARKADELGLLKMNPLDLAMRRFDPLDTNAGWPLFSSDPADFVHVANAFASNTNGGWWTPSGFFTKVDQLNAELGLVPELSLATAVSRRAGPTQKTVHVHEAAGGFARISSATKGFYTRGRLVYMVSRLLNDAISPLSVQVKEARVAVLGLGHDNESRQLYLKKLANLKEQGYFITESDFSGYDTSIREEIRLAVYEELRKAGFHRASIDILAAFDTERGVITPSWYAPTPGVASVYFGKTGLKSGMVETTNIGSFVAVAAMLIALDDQNQFNINAAKPGDDLPFMLELGDDVLLPTKVKLDEAKFAKSCAELGLKAKYIVGDRFLMRHIKPPVDYPVTSRIIQQTYFNEESYDHPGQLVLGLASRVEGKLMPHQESFLKKHLLEYFSGSLADMPTWEDIRKPEVISKRRDVLSFLRSAKGEAWLTSLQAKAAYIPAAAAMLSYMTRLGINTNTNFAIAHRMALYKVMLSKPNTASFKSIQTIGASLHR